jgi:membrane-associated phospholipid phosphatase
LAKTGLLRGALVAAAAAGIALPMLRKRLGVPNGVVTPAAWQAPLAIAVAFPRSKKRDAAIYTAQMLAYLAHYAMPYDDEERLMRRLRVNYTVRADRVIGLGELPTIRLQRLLGRPGEVRRVDTFLSAIHWVWFLVPHGTVAYVLVCHNDKFERSAAQVAAVFDLGLAGYWALPTAPPWWALREIKPDPVRRMMVEAGERFWGRLWQPLYDVLAGNPFAAMPSIHFGTSVISAHVMSDVGRTQGAIAWAYTATLGFALVYLGEHYVIDLIAGAALAETVRRLAPHAAPSLRAIASGIQQLELGRA